MVQFLLCFVVLVPVLYAFSVSLNADNSLLSTNFSFLPKHFTLANYKAVFTEKPIMLWLKNSLILAVVTLGISLGTGIPAAYVFSRISGQKSNPSDTDTALCISIPAFHDSAV